MYYWCFLPMFIVYWLHSSVKSAVTYGFRVRKIVLGFLGVAILMPYPSHALDESSLWLPVSYRPHYLKLIQSAKLVEDYVQGCETVIRGELHTGKSTKDSPVFRVVCRNEKKRSFAVMVDGITKELMDPSYPGGKVTFKELEKLQQLELARLEKEAELEAARLVKEAELEAERQELLRQEGLWLKCESKIAERTKLMKGMTMLVEGAPPVDVSREGHVKYIVDFDAKGPQGKHLRYRAFCDFDENESLRSSIRPRRTKPKEPQP